MELDCLLPHMRDVVRCHDSLRELNMTWRLIEATARMNCPEQAHGLLPMMAATREGFQRLENDLVQSLVQQKVSNVMEEAGMRARHTIDIIVRNLYERTADVGFLATDGQLCGYLAGLGPDRAQATERLRAYRNKYTVYQEVVLFNADGCVAANIDAKSGNDISREPLIARSLSSLITQALHRDAYVESFQATELRPGGGPALVYARRMLHPSSGAAVGVLCLVFDFAAEMAALFALRRASDGRSLILLLDGDDQVIASADPQWIGPGTSVPAHAQAQPGLCLHAGRQYLVQTFRSPGYQGYPGPPGWQAQVMVPLEVAFSGKLEGVLGTLETTVTDGLLSHARQFCPPLHGIVNAAETIRCVVWNGQVMTAVGGHEQTSLTSVLEQISDTGSRTNEVFAHSIRDLYDTVLAAQSSNARLMTQLLVELLDRNLYERSADCRWWAMTPDLRQALSQPDPNAVDWRQVRAVLDRIHALYTVYARLVVYDCSGRIVASTGPQLADGSNAVGQVIDADTLQAVLALPDSQAYHVSPFRSTPLYESRPTYVFHAAIRGLNGGDPVVGGIGIVFDSEREFSAMLREGLGAGADARAFYVDRDGRVIASTDHSVSAGSRLALPAEMRELANGEAAARVVVRDGQYMVLGCAVSRGYREFKVSDGYRDDVIAVLLQELGEVRPPRGGTQRVRYPAVQDRPITANASKYATVVLADGLYALPATHVLEALPASEIRGASLGARPHRLGLISRRREGLTLSHAWVFDLAGLVTGAPALVTDTSQVIIFRAGDLEVGLLVEELHGVPAFDAAQITTAPPLAVGPNSLISHLVRANSGALTIQLIDAGRLAARIARADTMLDAQFTANFPQQSLCETAAVAR